ncbi:hypothetical protein BDV18DRAFT_139322, partial [Aspergillus unguis]
MAPEPSRTTTTIVPINHDQDQNQTCQEPAAAAAAAASTSSTPSKDKPSKPRPVTSCAACRVRKVKCNRLSPCNACIARNTPEECTYAATPEEREAIAASELIAELRARRNKLQSRLLAKRGAGAASSLLRADENDYGVEVEEGEVGEEEEAMEALYAMLRRGEEE